MNRLGKRKAVREVPGKYRIQNCPWNATGHQDNVCLLSWSHVVFVLLHPRHSLTIKIRIWKAERCKRLGGEGVPVGMHGCKEPALSHPIILLMAHMSQLGERGLLVIFCP